MRYYWLCFVVFVFCTINAFSGLAKNNEGAISRFNLNHFLQDSTSKKDTVPSDTTALLQDSIVTAKLRTLYYNPIQDSVVKSPAEMAVFPAISLQQYLKGEVAGLYVRESSGEPGTEQTMYIRGTPLPLLSRKEEYQAQPLVILDGIPMVTEHPFAYDIQQYDFNRLGPATNIYAGIDMNNIASVQVLKDLAATAIYGPRAVNGAIVLTSKSPGNVRQISFNSYVGLAQRPSVTTINGKYENAFRQRFYDIYTTNGRYSDDENYPIYLSDSLNNVYSGKSDWSDLYYRNAAIYGINFGISGGTDRANFRFSLGNTKNQGVADGTGIDRYSAMFNISMKPLNWLVFSAMVNANRLERDRNRYLRDRLTQVNYFPDLTAPLPPNKDYYSNYITQYEKGFDNNNTNIIDGFARIGILLGKFKFITTFNVDYNEGYRDVFYARTLLQNNSYASNYYGFNQRLMLDNKATYELKIEDKHDFHFELGQSTQWDTYKYSNAYAYRGANDYIKVNLLQSDPNAANYLSPLAFPRELTYRFIDKTGNNLLSVYGRTDYTFNKKYSLGLTLRMDGSSNAQPTDRWFFSPVLSGAWNLKQEIFSDNSFVNDLILRASVGRLGRLNVYDNYSEGPQYTAQVGYTGNLTVPGYNGIAVLTRPYSAGWVGYGIPWAYSEQINIGADAQLLDERIHVSLDWYRKLEKNLILGVPDFAEYGYQQSLEPGMSVQNMGVDLGISAQIIRGGKFGWNAGLNLNHNQNKLKALPRGMDQIIIGNRLLKVGSPVDQYWLFKNDGIYTTDEQVPVVGGQPLKYNGVALQAGDPRWRDLNGDNVIDNNDKTLQGHSLPTIAGGFNNNLRYGNWNLSMDFYFNLGRKVINQEMASRFDFINREGNSDVNSIKEITFWEKRGDYSKYPLYNPWSTVIPYRVDQDLFLENASFLKMRNLTLGYDLTTFMKSKSSNITRFYVYGSVANLFTITPYTGKDPELVGYTGYDSGYGLPIPRTYTLGVKMDL